MDGIDPAIYKNIGNVKARNPNLKIVIALGGWTFSDPGPWQDKFPSLASTKENRATFINNLLGFLSEYGYDGVDWEYPGADDRGGKDGDGANYVALVKELREAINSRGRDYIVTFTAPSSYWYLRHFDLKGMETYVDWINLMSYDLHGVWDSDNPIGNQVLSHTNLTEIDYALDLFWRVGVEPSSIVLGLGFYGRSFELESASCWKPGCAFKGPGSPGRCSNTAGILSYAGNFDDAETFQMKIDYASKMGLHGLMIWAIDLDTPNLEALRSISNGELIGATKTPFSLDYALINFGSNANAGEIDPDQTGFGFVLITGDSAAVSSLKKREDEPEPLVFLDCPADVLEQPKNETRVARVVCLSENVEGCFRIMERGVEGTVVEMPDNCAPNSLARAISLTESKDQSLPSTQSRRAVTSKVFDFAFDMNLNNTRRDTGDLKVRVDYSNVGGYWNAAVDSLGIQADDSLHRRIAKRFFAESQADWRTMYQDTEVHKSDGERFVNEEIDTPLFWETAQDCEFEGEDYELGFGAHVGGKIKADFTYGFSLIAELRNILDAKQANGWLNVDGESDLNFSIGGVGEVDFDLAKKGNPTSTETKPVKLKGHTLHPSGNSWLSFQPYYKIGYTLASFNDTDGEAGSDSAPYFDGKLSTRIKSDFGGFNVNFPPNPSDKLGTRNVARESNMVWLGNDNIIHNSGGAGGRFALGAFLSFGVKIDLGLFKDRCHRNIPIIDMSMDYRTVTEWSFFRSPDFTPETCLNTSVSWVPYTRPLSGRIEKASQLAHIIDIERSRSRTTKWMTSKSPSSVVRMVNINLSLPNSKTIGWNESEALPYIVSDSQKKGGDSSCYQDQPSLGADMAWGYGSDSNINPLTYMDEEAAKAIEGSDEELSCPTCLVCGKNRKTKGPCCGCANMDLELGYTDIPDYESYKPEVDLEGPWPWPGYQSTSSLSRRGQPDPMDGQQVSRLESRKDGTATMSPKTIRVCPDSAGAGVRKFALYGKTYGYPAFPENALHQWEGIEGNKWDDVSRSWGNTSMSCSDWEVDALRPHDTAWIRGANGNLEEVRANYQTEHVFEGQLISDFFTQWLDKGQIENQKPTPSNPTPKVPCNWTVKWILTVNKSWPWKLRGKPRAFIFLLLSELGNASHLDRLAIFKARPNGMKGSMFGGKQPSALGEYRRMSGEQKLLATKEMGMVFRYMNDPIIWKKFCDTYEALYELFGTFDTFYAQQGSGLTIPSLQKEWKEFIEVGLTSLVARSKASFELHTIIAFGGIFTFDPSMLIHGIHWVKNIAVNQPKIRIDGSCPNLGSIDNGD
ncbi:Chitinase [Fusarium keratoplasticum]|nr:Chitinase [Fusarium keratoplasticum]